MTRIEPKPEGGLVATTIRNTGETLHWLGRRFGRAGRGHVTRRVLDIWREGGRTLVRDHMLSERAAARRDLRYRIWMSEIEPGLFDQVVVDPSLIERGPKFSIIVPVFNTEPAMLQACIESARNQTYGKWSLVLVDDASTRQDTRELVTLMAKGDDRIALIRRETRGGISAATNDGLNAAAGEYIALLDHDDELSPHALAAMAREVVKNEGVELLYSDEDKIDERGSRHTPVFKPALSPHHLLTSNYCCHLLVVRTELLREVGGLRAAFNGAQDYDLVLRCLERSVRIAHVPLVLYHWRTHRESTSGAGRAKPYAVESGRQALLEFVKRQNLDATVDHSPFLLSYRVRAKVTVDDQVEVVRTRCDGTIVGHLWRQTPAQHGSRWVLFLSQQVRSISAQDVRALVEAAKLPHAGPVGGIIIGPNGRIDDAGWLVDRFGEVRGRYRGCSTTLPGVGWALRLPRNVSFVGPQCLLVERSEAQRALSVPDCGDPWYVRLAQSMSRHGRVAQIVGEVQLCRTNIGSGDLIPRRVQGEWSGLFSEHHAYVEPEYAPLHRLDENRDLGDEACGAEEDRCAASSV